MKKEKAWSKMAVRKKKEEVHKTTWKSKRFKMKERFFAASVVLMDATHYRSF
jgi:hypothetical protein